MYFSEDFALTKVKIKCRQEHSIDVSLWAFSSPCQHGTAPHGGWGLSLRAGPHLSWVALAGEWSRQGRDCSTRAVQPVPWGGRKLWHSMNRAPKQLELSIKLLGHGRYQCFNFSSWFEIETFSIRPCSRMETWGIFLLGFIL